jgi:predicted transport protein
MSDIKLFRLQSGKAEEIKGVASDLEKPLQSLIESNLEALLGVRFLASEYSTGKTHAGRIDTLGLDENACPVILEYKRSLNENVINQGLYYLDWLMDHKAEFKLLALERFDKATADAIDWTAPRLICIAADFTKYDEHAVQQINRNIELIRYRKFGDDLLLLELVNAVSASPTASTPPKTTAATSTATDKPFSQAIHDALPTVQEVYATLKDFTFTLGDDVQLKELKLYVAFKRLKNFVCVVVNKGTLSLTLKLNPDSVTLEQGFSRDVRQIGHWGTGDLELTLRTFEDFEKAKPLIRRAYDGG